jgi:hypothetical protein
MALKPVPKHRVAYLPIVAFIIAATIVTTITALGCRAETHVVVAKIRTALSTGVVTLPPVFERNQKTGIDTFTVCLVLQIATFNYHHDVGYALAAAPYYGGDDHPCDHLADRIGPPPPQLPLDDYWRYWWGSASLLNIALGLGGMSLSAYQSTLKFSCYALILLLGGAALIRYRRAALPLLPLLVALMFGFGLPLFGLSIAQIPGLIIGMILLLIYMVAGIDRATQGWQLVYLFTVGGVVFYFDLLNGNLVALLICFALTRVIGICAFGPPVDCLPFRVKAWPTSAAIVELVAAYCMGAVSVLLLRILSRSIFLGQNPSTVAAEWLDSFGTRVTSRYVHSSKFQLSDASAAAPQQERGLQHALRTLKHLYENIDAGTYPYLGQNAALFVYAVCALVFAVLSGWLVYRARKLEAQRLDIYSAVVLITLIVPVWYCIFMNHAYVHFWMMSRLLSLFSAMAISLALLLAAGRPRRL